MLYFDVQNAYNFKSDQPDYLVRAEDGTGKPLTDPNDPNKYLLKTLKSNSGTVLPTLGIMIEFWEFATANALCFIEQTFEGLRLLEGLGNRGQAISQSLLVFPRLKTAGPDRRTSNNLILIPCHVFYVLLNAPSRVCDLSKGLATSRRVWRLLEGLGDRGQAIFQSPFCIPRLKTKGPDRNTRDKWNDFNIQQFFRLKMQLA